MIFCKHNWKLIGKTSYEGVNLKGINLAFLTAEQIDTAMKMAIPTSGFLFQCSKCKKIKKVVLSGKEK